MSIYDCFYDSIAGMHRAEGYLEQAASYIANPANWYEGSSSSAPATASSETSFSAILSNAMNSKVGQDGEPGESGGSSPPSTYAPPTANALDGLGVGQGQGPDSLLDAMVLALIAQRMYEANARMFAIENKIVGIIIHLGEENYRGD
jgi:hypothetical protein